MKHIMLFEYYEKAVKLYGKTNILTQEELDRINDITKRSPLTEYLAKVAASFKEVRGSYQENDLFFFLEFMHTYVGNFLPVTEIVRDLHGVPAEDIVKLIGVLKVREKLVETINRLPSIFKRNHKEEFAEPKSIHDNIIRYYEDLTEDLNNIMYQLTIIRDGADVGEAEKVEAIAFSSTYKTVKDVLEYVESYIDGQQNSESHFTEMLADGELKVIAKKKTGRIILVDSHDKMRRAFGNSSWCFSRFGSSDYWYSYASKGYVYIFDNYKDVYVILANNQVYDSENNHIDEMDGMKILSSFGIKEY